MQEGQAMPQARRFSRRREPASRKRTTRFGSRLTTSLPSRLVLAGKATAEQVRPRRPGHIELPRPHARLCNAAGGP